MHGIYFKSENELNHFCFSRLTFPFGFIFSEMIEKIIEGLVDDSWNKTIMAKDVQFIILVGSFKELFSTSKKNIYVELLNYLLGPPHYHVTGHNMQGG